MWHTVKGLGVLFLLSLVALSGCGGAGSGDNDAGKSQKPLVLTLGHVLNTDHPVHKAMVFMGERLKEKSGGSIELRIFESGQLGAESDMLDQVQIGALSMTKCSAAPLEQNVPIMGVFSVPYMFRNNEHYWKVLNGPIGKHILAAGVGAGYRGLCFYDAGSRSFYTKDKPVLSPADLKGMKIRVMESKTAMSMLTALGASPTPIPFSELYTSLSQGTVDGAENNPPSFFTSRHFEVCKYFSLDEHAMVPDILIISEKKWQSLTDEQRKLIQEAADESSAYERELWAEATQKALDEVQAVGVEVFHPDKDPFVTMVKGMHDSYVGTAIGDMIAQIKAVK